jgi:hypothetical protein
MLSGRDARAIVKIRVAAKSREGPSDRVLTFCGGKPQTARVRSQKWVATALTTNIVLREGRVGPQRLML